MIDCERIKEIPSSFGYICTLKTVRVVSSSKAASSVRRIFKRQRDMGNKSLRVFIRQDSDSEAYQLDYDDDESAMMMVIVVMTMVALMYQIMVMKVMTGTTMMTMMMSCRCRKRRRTTMMTRRTLIITMMIREKKKRTVGKWSSKNWVSGN